MIDIETREGIARLRLTHGKANVLDLALLESVSDALETLTADDAVKSLVITGNGRLFSAGVDLFQVRDGGADYIARFLPALSSTLERLFLFPKPVVAAVEGHAIAGGLIIAMACDRVLMAAGAGKLGLTELRVGVPLPGMPLEITRHRLGSTAASRLILDADTMDVNEAAARGVVDAVVAADDLLDEAESVARALASLPADAFAITKRQLRAQALTRAHETDDDAMLAIWSSPAALGRIADFLEATVGKRPTTARIEERA